mmetsp:Transcript_18346/g.40537  ORF Transcript_18346/g.40537 Transcript_18346/m.40537 type:complete len:246 (-) Transcript_18346:1595-2332(-)
MGFRRILANTSHTLRRRTRRPTSPITAAAASCLAATACATATATWLPARCGRCTTAPPNTPERSSAASRSRWAACSRSCIANVRPRMRWRRRSVASPEDEVDGVLVVDWGEACPGPRGGEAMRSAAAGRPAPRGGVVTGFAAADRLAADVAVHGGHCGAAAGTVASEGVGASSCDSTAGTAGSPAVPASGTEASTSSPAASPALCRGVSVHIASPALAGEDGVVTEITAWPAWGSEDGVATEAIA